MGYGSDAKGPCSDYNGTEQPYPAFLIHLVTGSGGCLIASFHITRLRLHIECTLN